MKPALLEVSIVLFLASVSRSALGFGGALIAVPLLALVVAVPVAAAVPVLAAITSALIRLASHSFLQRSLAGPLECSRYPVATIALKSVPGAGVKAALAGVIIAFSVYSIVCRPRREVTDDGYSWLFGFIAGILGGAYGMNGPPLAIYGSLRGWSPKQFRATIQGYFLPASLIGMCGHGITGLWTAKVNHFHIGPLPQVLAATFLGRKMNNRLNPCRFHSVVHDGLIAIGLILLTQA